MVQVFSQRKNKPSRYQFMKPSELGYDSDEYLSFDPIEFAISKDGIDWRSEFDNPELKGTYCYKAPDVQPANPVDNLQKVALMDGSRLLSTSYGTRELKMGMIFRGMDEGDAMLAYDALQRFLISRDPYWICFANWPQRMYYVRAKLAAPTFASEKSWTCEVTFTDIIGLSRSVGTTQEPVLGFGNNLEVQPRYSFNSNSFTLVNTSDVLIDPERRGHPFKMTLQGSSSGKMKVTNTTTSTSIYKESGFNGSFVLDGVEPSCNGKNCSIDTDCGIITLQIGENHFQVDNFNGTITFDYPEWWLS